MSSPQTIDLEAQALSEPVRFQPPAAAMAANLAVVSETSAILSMIERFAKDPSIDLTRIEKLMDMKRQIERDAAKRAFIAAKANAKGEIPIIAKNAHVSFEGRNGGTKTDYWHETLAEVERTIDPILHKHGLDYRFRLSQPGDRRITVTCILAHVDGHEEETTITAIEDDSGNKNPVQKIVSTSTYLQRATLKLALGLAASKDDDGQGGPDVKPADKAEETPEEVFVSDEQIETIRKALAFRGKDEARLLTALKVPALQNLYANSVPRVLEMINQGGAR